MLLICYVDQFGLDQRDIPAFASQALELRCRIKVCDTMHHSIAISGLIFTSSMVYFISISNVYPVLR